MPLHTCNSDAFELQKVVHLVTAGALLTWLRNNCQQLPHISNFFGCPAFISSFPTNCADITHSLPASVFETSFGFVPVNK